jgi:hypothetical protein
MSSLKIIGTKETYREIIKKKGIQINIFKSINNFETFCMEGKANIISDLKEVRTFLTAH